MTKNTEPTAGGTSGNGRPIGVGDASFELETPFRLFRFPSTFASLRHRNFRLFFVGQLLSLIGSWMQIAALSWLIYDMTGSKEKLGIIGAVRFLPIVLFSLLGGVLADRLPKRKILIVTQSTFMALSLTLAGLVYFDVVALGHIVVLSVLAGCVLAFDMPTRHSLVAELVDGDDVSNAVALNSSAFNAARILGPALAGVLMMRAGIAICFLANGLSYIAVIASLLMVRTTKRAADDHENTGTALEQILEGFSIVARRPAVRGVLLLVVVTGVFGLSYGVIMPAFAKDILGLGEGGYGLLLSANGAGALIGGLLVATFSRIKHKLYVIAGGVMIFSAMLFLFASTTNFWLAAASLAGAGMGFMLFMSTGNAIVQTGVPDAARGRVMGVWSLMFIGAMPIGSLQIGFLSERLAGGAPLAVKIGSVICAACGVYALYALMRKKNGRVPTDRPRSS